MPSAAKKGDDSDQAAQGHERGAEPEGIHTMGEEGDQGGLSGQSAAAVHHPEDISHDPGSADEHESGRRIRE